MVRRIVEEVLPKFKNMEDYFKKDRNSFIEFCHSMKSGVCEDIRNEYKLWDSASPYTVYFNRELNIQNPKEMSIYIAGKVWDKYQRENNLLRGFRQYRHDNNPLEKIFHDTFVKEFSEDIDSIVYPIDTEEGVPVEELNFQEKRIMVTFAQWLGSPQGQFYLSRCGYEPVTDYIPKTKLLEAKVEYLSKKLDRIPNWIKVLLR